MLSLNTSQKYLDEVRKFEQQISHITNNANKQKARHMLDALKNEVELINNGHAPNHDGNIDPHTLRDNVSSLQYLRYNLIKLLESA